MAIVDVVVLSACRTVCWVGMAVVVAVVLLDYRIVGLKEYRVMCKECKFAGR